MRTFLLALLGSIPAVAHATCTVDATGGAADYVSLQDAINGCPLADMPIELLSDVNEDVTIARHLMINGGGFTLTGTGGGSVMTITWGTSMVHDLGITGGDAVYGGGVRAHTGTFVTFDDVRVYENAADVGGGIASQGILRIIGGEVRDNVATTSGGGIAALGSGAGQYVNVTAATVEGNSAGEDGGGIYVSDAGLAVEATIVRANTAGGSGGGVRSEAVSNGAYVLVWSTFLSRNTAAYKGGGLSVVNALVTMNQSESYANTAGLDGGGVYIDTNADVFMENSTISNNTAAAGGGIRLGGTGVHSLSQLTVVDNHAASAEQLSSTSTNLQAAAMAFGESGANNGVVDCSVASGQVRYTVSVDGTCRTAHASNQTAPLGLLPIFVGMYRPTQLSVLKDFVPAGYCSTSDQTGVSRSPYPCDGGAVEH